MRAQTVSGCSTSAFRVFGALLCLGFCVAPRLVPYRDVPPPVQHEDASSVWLRGLPPLERNNSALQWCERTSGSGMGRVEAAAAGGAGGAAGAGMV